LRAVLQRVTRAAVTVAGQELGAIGTGLVVLLAVRRGDTAAEADWLAAKVPELRLFPGPGGSCDRSLAEVGGSLLVISQFTLYGQTRKGRRPNFQLAAEPAEAEALYQRFVQRLEAAGHPVACGRFGAMMLLELVNDGPVTVLVERERPGLAEGGPAEEGPA
jgi:D-tyrosyl-tRNA(Tyr) deacylase